MADIAFTQGGNMINTLADRQNAIMTGAAGICCGAVIEHRYCPLCTAMADITFPCGRYVCRPFTRGNHPIVATTASADHFRVIDQRVYGGPSSRAMTCFAIIRSVNVSWLFATGNRAVMTGDTGLTCYRGVIEAHQPVICVVTTVAGIHCGDVQRSFSTCDDTVVATVTGADDFSMIHRIISDW